VGLGSDGAPNMVGVRNGLAAKLRDDIGEHFTNIHCFNHRLELAWKHSVKQMKVYEKLMTLLTGLWKFYHKQHKNKRGLQNTFKAFNMPCLVPPKVTGTRWLPHLSGGVRSLLRNFKAYHAHLSTMSHTNPKAEGLVKILLDKNVLAFVLFLKVLINKHNIEQSYDIEGLIKY